jgi:nitroreductase
MENDQFFSFKKSPKIYDRDMNENLLNTIATRHCKRAFLPKPVSKETLISVLKAAQQAPSSKNTQSWQVAVCMGAKRDQLSAELCQQYDLQKPAAADYLYMNEPMDAEFKKRARECGYALFKLKGIGRDDIEARQAHGRENFSFFGAPVHMIFHTPRNANPGMFLDMGLYLQSVMLGLHALGLGSCPQFSVAGYPDTVRSCLGLGEERMIVSGLSLGYVDEGAKVNGFIPQRLPLEDVVTWM